eukprot:c10894_g1_i1.p1 GENE.c10894_g1_i1~~c10894_g1_i1.p1  ORF type:complete len:547 (+),score=156.61 c10894_g1_i1:65-1642(+)
MTLFKILRTSHRSSTSSPTPPETTAAAATTGGSSSSQVGEEHQQRPQHEEGKSRFNQHVLDAEYAVRGALVQRAMAIKKELSNGTGSHLFDKVVFCNIGNPKALGQPSLTFCRQVMAACHFPALCDDHTDSPISPEARARARRILASTDAGCIGAYTHSQGLESIREEVSEFLHRRDGFPSNVDKIFLSDGASPAIKFILQLIISHSKVGVMVPTPQYPLYSASITLNGGQRVSYDLNGDDNWGLTRDSLDAAISHAVSQGIDVRAICIINPGNPTGQCLSEENIAMVIRFAKQHSLMLLADEVYQENIYNPARPFVSFRKVLHSMGPDFSTVELLSFHSTSKGVFGECGYRGGFMETTNLDPVAHEQLYKLASISLCPNTSGQIMASLMVNPPRQGDASYDQYHSEYVHIFESLKRRALMVTEILNTVEGIECQPVTGAMYAFPKITIPPKAVEAAANAHSHPDAFFALQLLEATGVCVVPGSGFGKVDGSWHFRTTILPPEDQLRDVLAKIAVFYRSFREKYA